MSIEQLQINQLPSKLPKSSFSSKILNLIAQSINTPNFFIEVRDNVMDINGTTYYTCYFGYELTDNTTEINYDALDNQDVDYMTRTILFRYSEVLNLYTELVKRYSSVHKFEPFPQKHYFNRSNSVINERINGFRLFLEDLNTICDIINDSDLREFLCMI